MYFFRFNNFHTVNRCKFMSLTQKLGQVIVLSTLMFGSFIPTAFSASVRNIFHKRCHGHYCLEIKSIIVKFLKNGANGKLYSLNQIIRDYSDGTLTGVKITKGKFREDKEPTYIYCSTSKPAVIFKHENNYLANIINPGGFVDSASTESHVFYWNTCHNYNPSNFFSMERRAKRLGYPLNLQAKQIKLKNGRYDGISFVKCRRLRVGRSSVCTQDRNGSLNLRTRPSLYSRIIRRIPNRSAVRILSSRSNWSKVRYRGNIGWVSNDFLC